MVPATTTAPVGSTLTFRMSPGTSRLARLSDAGFDVVERHLDYEDLLDLVALVGGLLSAFPVQDLPSPQRRHELAARVGRALAPETAFTEHARVSMLAGAHDVAAGLSCRPRASHASPAGRHRLALRTKASSGRHVTQAEAPLVL
jgi:hypothetical protein